MTTTPRAADPALPSRALFREKKSGSQKVEGRRSKEDTCMDRDRDR
eukprot:CAMPEP_0206493534 /NCGR_PEP_ID=MMETSP0324_2-20121206/47058_1 /ASSEMBLY_ACC=CAM_ASM_000836 /TAXON_ID=2866 /ORGANISM="Crypthecodinium cohnii, Strain Seligo" /LENGTH=45 /DNA_ID= /DNA_START= /DNA_END= /DNA_ORIENTATION=